MQKEINQQKVYWRTKQLDILWYLTIYKYKPENTRRTKGKFSSPNKLRWQPIAQMGVGIYLLYRPGGNGVWAFCIKKKNYSILLCWCFSIRTTKKSKNCKFTPIWRTACSYEKKIKLWEWDQTWLFTDHKLFFTTPTVKHFRTLKQRISSTENIQQ